MARGTEFAASEYIVSNTFGNPPGLGGSIAEAVLIKNGIPINFRSGSSLPGYDIKSQDCVNMLRLSLLAGAGGTDLGPEVYCGPDGVARLSTIGNASVKSDLLYTSTLGQYESKIEHVLVKGKQPLPTRYHGGTISLMGQGRLVSFNNMNCTYTPSSKNGILNVEAWAEFERSQNSEETQNLIKNNLVQRSKWEQLVGFKASFPDIPSYASMSLSQVTPRIVGIPFGNVLESSVTVSIGDSTPDGGGLFDISSVTIIGSQIVSIETGQDLVQNFPELLAEDPNFPATDKDYYVLLDHQCGLSQLSRGQNWFVVPAGQDSVGVYLKGSGADSAAYDIFYGFDSNTYFFRRKPNNGIIISSVSDGLKRAQDDGESFLLTFNNYMMSNPPRGEIVVGLGGNNGHEVNSIILNYSITKSSIQIRSPHGNADAIAASVAAGGVNYSSIVIQEKPAPTAHATLEGCNVVYPKAPPNEEGVMFDVDSELDELEGTVLDISAPFLGEAGVCTLASLISSLANSEVTCKTYSYAGGGYELIPGMEFEGGTILSIEHGYGDKDSITTSVTVGPKYYPVGSYQDSTYIKRAESITRTGLVVGGSNKEGVFAVQVDGRGIYQAILGTIEPVYPGDRVELKIINVPIERD